MVAERHEAAAAPRLILVTDRGYSDDAIVAAVEAAASAVPRGALAVQLRDKRRPIVELRVFASRLRVTTRQAGAMLVINGDARLAHDVGADGVHLGGDAISIAAARSICGPGAWISIAAHSDAAVRAAAAQGANAALVSPIFATAKKPPRGIEALASARAIAESAKSALLLYALGGVTPALARRCVQAGAYGMAAIRALLAAPSPAAEARAFLAAMDL